MRMTFPHLLSEPKWCPIAVCLLMAAGTTAHGQTVERPEFAGVSSSFPTADVTSPFNIVINYPATQGGVTCATPTPAESAAFAAAEFTWESVITGYRENVGTATLTIGACIGPIDGPGLILGSAGPTTAKGGTATWLYSNDGVMTFDSADTPGLGSSLNDVILHEMGHVIGVGTLWSSAGVGLPGYQELYVSGTGEYTGPAALAAFKTEFTQPAATFVPVELGGGPGTEDAHWNEGDGGTATGLLSAATGQDMQFELMTGWLNAPTFMSSVTKQGMVDLGYTVIPEPPTTSLLGALALVLVGVVRRVRR